MNIFEWYCENFDVPKDMSDFKDYYTILGVKETCSPEEANQGFKRKTLHLRPDINLDEATRNAFEDLKEAREVLSDPVKNLQYKSFCNTFYTGQLIKLSFGNK